MKKHLLALMLIVAMCSNTQAQFFQGLRSSPFGGVTNVPYNPAIADNRFLVDINIINFGATVNNNYIGVSKKVFNKNSDFYSGNGNFQDQFLKERINGNNKYAYVGMQAQGPLSFMFSFGSKENRNKNALAFTYHINSVTNVDNFDETFSRIAYLGAGFKADSILNFVQQNLTDANPSIKTLNWVDYGITYSRVAYDKGAHMVKVGGTLKLLQGVAGGYVYVKDLKYKWENFDTISVFQTSANYAHSEGLITSEGFPADKIGDYAKNLVSFKYSAPSAAVDLGVIYEWRPDKDKYKYQMDCKDEWRLDKNRYKLAAGLSIVDLGAISFNKGQYSGNFVANINNWDVGNAQFPDGLQSINDTIRSRFVYTDDGKKKFTMWLPTRINMFIDYNIAYGFGLNLAASISPNMAPRRNMVNHGSNISLTPKFDHAWFGVYLPLSYDFRGNVGLGATLRMGPLTVGTGDFLAFFAKKHVFNADIHATLKITIPYAKKRDRDKDGVSNKLDLCKKDKGNCLSQGCPDRDGDGVLDADDRCPDIAGPKEFKGCPDTDGDGIVDVDDSCVTVKGIAQFYGCPDSDSDGVEDKLDECIDVPGLAEFKGCPDRDKDGTPDKTDDCIDVPGALDHAGCPDTDGDGIYDNEDKCINTKGPKENAGCPWPDTDGDGVLDKDDACPKVPGVAENKGCPKLDKKEIETVKYAFENLEFETGKDIIRKNSYPSLTALASLLVKKPNYGLKIEGHTDSQGTDANNLVLSQKRAAAVKAFLVNKGVSTDNLVSEGFGESRPVADNTTAPGRQKNRRVEMTITFK